MSQIAAELQSLMALSQIEDYHALSERCGWLLDRQSELEVHQSARVHELAGLAADARNRFQDAAAHFTTATALFDSLGCERDALRCELGRIYAQRGSETFDQMLFEAARCLEMARAAGWLEEAAEAHHIMATALRARHEYAEAIENCEAVFELLGPDAARRIFSKASATLAWSLNALGRHEEAEGHMRAAFAVYQGLDNQILLRRELGSFAFQAWCRGELERARVLTQEQIESAQRDGDTAQVSMSRFNMAIYAAHTANWTEARRQALQAWQRQSGAGIATFESAVLMLLALIALHSGQPQESLNYMRLAEGALRDLRNDEAILLDYYYSLALLANGAAEEALARWSARQELAASVENEVEVGWLLRALLHLQTEQSSEWERSPALRAAAEEMVRALEAWPARPLPAPELDCTKAG
ncbi:hypothetical protein IT575_09450 [bacterium]|nr:hypothetical protein [bacterium]